MIGAADGGSLQESCGWLSSAGPGRATLQGPPPPHLITRWQFPLHAAAVIPMARYVHLMLRDVEPRTILRALGVGWRSASWRIGPG